MSGAERPGDLQVSVILCLKNAERDVVAQLAGLAAQRTRVPWELLVVDNGCTDGTMALVETWREANPEVLAHVVDASDQPGLSSARNAGRAAARGSALLFCDGDDVVADGWIDALLGGLAFSPVAGGRLELGHLNPSGLARAAHDLTANGLPDWLGHNYAVGANMGVRADVFDLVGGFDPALHACGDDIDFCVRIGIAGGQPVFVPEAIVHYRLRRTVRTLVKQQFRYGTVCSRLAAKHGKANPPVRSVLREVGHLVLAAPELLGGEAQRRRWVRALIFRAGCLWGLVRFGRLSW